jgi:hypothetical protein
MSEYPVYTGMRSAGPPLLSRGAGFLAAIVVLPVFLVTDLPFGGYLLGVGLFAANWLAAIALDRIARGKMQVTAVGITGLGLISRAWITFGALFVFAKMVDSDIGVVGAIVFLVLFTVDFLARAISHTVARSQPPAPAPTRAADPVPEEQV